MKKRLLGLCLLSILVGCKHSHPENKILPSSGPDVPLVGEYHGTLQNGSRGEELQFDITDHGNGMIDGNWNVVDAAAPNGDGNVGPNVNSIYGGSRNGNQVAIGMRGSALYPLGTPGGTPVFDQFNNQIAVKCSYSYTIQGTFTGSFEPPHIFNFTYSGTTCGQQFSGAGNAQQN